MRLSLNTFCIASLLLAGFARAQYQVDTLFSAPQIAFPVAIAFPDDGSGRIFFTEKNNGKVRVAHGDSLVTAPFVTVSVTGGSERGLLGIALHPQFADSPYVYIYYTRSTDQRNQIVRYLASGDLGTNPETLLVTTQTPTQNHNGGNIHFGPDGKLYVTIGDYLNPPHSQDTTRGIMPGKIHRLNPDGSVPSDNPFPGNSLYAYGLRNSFDFAFDPVSGKCYATENGPSCNDEINLVEPGGNYGWPADGNCTYTGNPQYTAPLYYWESPVPSFTGITTYRDTQFPGLYGKLLVAGWNTGTIYQFDLNATGDSIIAGPAPFYYFGVGLNDVEIGPDGYIYVVNGDFSGNSNIFRLRPPALSRPEVIGVFGSSTLPTFRWHSSSGAVQYELQLAGDSTFTTLWHVDSTLTDTSAATSGFFDQTRVYWRVRGRAGTARSEWSETIYFKALNGQNVFSFAVGPTWNLLSIPLQPDDAHRSTLFPSALSSAFAFRDGYSKTDLMQQGVGYWMKFSSGELITITGAVPGDTIEVTSGWNIIGAPDWPVDVSSISTLPAGILETSFFEYENGYAPTTTLRPGHGYWVKVTDTGRIILR